MKDLSGNKYGRWIVIGFAGKNGSNSTWICKCKCGRVKTVKGTHLICGNSKSCGCFNHELMAVKNTKHGAITNHKPSTEYMAWQSAKTRCTNPNSRDWKDYGGRGIKMCGRWMSSFKNFIDDMGLKPSPNHSIDRYPNNNGNYTPSNCRWATPKEQRANRRNPISTYNQETK